MKIYIDKDYKCHTTRANGRRAVEVSAFDGKCKACIEGYRYVPYGETWTREDGVAFSGELIAPWKEYAQLVSAQEVEQA